jgi:hypothetical protein
VFLVGEGSRVCLGALRIAIDLVDIRYVITRDSGTGCLSRHSFSLDQWILAGRRERVLVDAIGTPLRRAGVVSRNCLVPPSV